MVVRTDKSSSSAAAAAAAAAEAARQRAAAEAAKKAAETKAKAAAAAAEKKAAAEAAKAKPKDNFAKTGATAKPVALDGKPTAANAADIAKAKAETPPVSDKLPKDPAQLPEMFKELRGADKETVKKTYDALNSLATGNESEKLKAMADLYKQFPTTLGNVLEKMGVKDNKLVKIATNKDALGALSTLTDAKASVADKAAASLSLAKAVGDSIAPEELQGVLKTTLSGLPAAEKLVSAIGAWTDPSKTGLEKAKATLELGSALKDFAGDAFPKLANKLRSADGPLKAAGAALTLLDPKASTEDKVIAGAQLAAEIPDLGKNVSDFKELLKNAGVKNAEKIAEGATKAADVAVKGLDPKLAKSLSEAETKSLKELSEKFGAKELEPVLKGITDKTTLKALEKQLGGLEPAAGKRLLSTLGGLEHGVLEKALKNPELAQSLTKLATKLDDDGAKVVAKLVKDFDEAGLKTLVKFTDHLGADGLKNGLKALEPAIEKGGSKVLMQGLKVLDKVLGKVGVKITGEVAEKAIKNLVKVVPVVGAIPNAIDAVKYTKEAVELRDKNKDLGYLAMTAAQLNAADGVVGIALDLTGVGIGVDVAVSVGFSAAELALDIGFDQEKAKLLADPENYKAPDWVKAVNLAGAAAQGPVGLANMAAYYGPEGAAQLVEWGVEKGVKGSIELTKLAGETLAKGVGEDLKMKGKMLHALADVVRNPEKYGRAAADAAVKTYNEVIEKGGELADAAKKQLGDIVDEAKKLGTKGLETMKWIAQNPGPAAKIALDGIKSAVNTAIDTGTDAAKAIAKKGLETLKDLHTGYENLKGAAKDKAKELLIAAKDGIASGIDKAVKLGEKGVDLVVWAANNPGEVWKTAKTAVNDALAKGGAIAEKTWDSIKSLGNKGIDLAKDAITALKAGGEKAVDTLKYVIANPGEAATKVRDWAGQTLKDMVLAGGDAAKKAAGAIKDFIDNRMDWAKKLGQDLLKQGSEAFLDVAKAWKDNLTTGGKEFLDGLKDLGSAGVEQLEKLAKIGGQAAEYAVGKLESLAKAGVAGAKAALGTLAEFGGEVGRVAKNAANSVANATNGEFSIRGYKIDLNPLW